LLEFGMTLPILLLLSLTGAELTNYIITRMRVSQVALHLADNAARIGSGSQLQAKQITEADINDLLTGAGLQAGELDLYRNGRVIISSIEPSIVNPANSRIRWQRCRGSKVRASSYPTEKQKQNGATADNMPGMGPDGRQVSAPPNGVTMFVEVYYEYQPLVKASIIPDDVSKMTEIASMMVRDRRDTAGGNNGVYQVNGVTPSNC
jgi:hypothetical protein